MLTTLVFVTAITSSYAFCGRLNNARTSVRLNNFNSEVVPVSQSDATSKAIQNVLKFGSIAGILSAASLVAYAADDEVPKPDTTGFTETDSGLKYKDTTLGEGAKPIPGEAVRVHYTGWLDDFEGEKKFDSSYDRRQPLSFKVGVKQVIAGWDEGLLTNMKVGGKRELIIPPELGYGSRGAGGVIPPNATLYFKIELVGIGAKANR